jgi:hypothetical protein
MRTAHRLEFALAFALWIADFTQRRGPMILMLTGLSLLGVPAVYMVAELHSDLVIPAAVIFVGLYFITTGIQPHVSGERNGIFLGAMIIMTDIAVTTIMLVQSWQFAAMAITAMAGVVLLYIGFRLTQPQ